MEARVCNPAVFTPPQRARHDQLVRELFEVAEPDPEWPEGFRLPAEDSWVMKAAEWMTLERRCCPHFRFQLEVGPELLRFRAWPV